jgi:hypothetical protein
VWLCLIKVEQLCRRADSLTLVALCAHHSVTAASQGITLIDATYLCGLSRWLLVGGGTDSIPTLRHAVWNPRARDGTATIEESEASITSTGRATALPGNVDWRGVGKLISGFFSHGAGGSPPLAPPEAPEKVLFTGFDRNA